MDFHNLAYWQQKARELTIETRLFINGEYSAAADNSVFTTVDPAAQQTLAEVARGKKPTSIARSRPPAAFSIAATGRRRLLPSAKRCCINSPT